MNEFDLIAQYFTRPVRYADLGVGDDAALMTISPNHQLAVSADMLVEGRHFFADADPYRLGHKCLAVNLSDLAAMGAKPTWFTLSLALPEIKPDWLARFSQGMFALADEHQIELVGGDTTRGPLTIAIQVAGEVPTGQAMLRSGAQIGDDIWVSGPLGAAAAAVMHRTGRAKLPEPTALECDLRLDLPQPRVIFGQAIAHLAHAALDISDGLAGDLRHICNRSHCGAVIHIDAVPMAPQLQPLAPALALEAKLAGGDDYELCFTAPHSARSALQHIATQCQLNISRIGEIVATKGLHFVDQHQQAVVLPFGGFDHFKTS
ncbi:thiamine-phosphate kinase [Chitinibacter bivalviorum]|uniref:Thiamine-monophosphate kinase n=1 Tax=Chitinibacter bivalviorum TaxID=2739434 RepID=A0A7H9BGE0_9NEIS|nr:thiamine-phosphate kinase [Chitinibacter bivalviorum]QLG87609.1 thiamine-phosphate kinase [Chitinibacter bivalviorum]